MSKKEEMLQTQVDKLREEVAALKEANLTLKEKVRHYEVAVSAVKWLWDQAVRQTPFQL